MKTMIEYTYKPTMADLAKATSDLEAALVGVPDRERMILMVAADEIFANIVRYSGANDWTLQAEVFENHSEVRLTFTDDGTPFDPLSEQAPNTTLTAEERAVGGMGIFIVIRTMSQVTYERQHGRNVLMMSLKIS